MFIENRNEDVSTNMLMNIFFDYKNEVILGYKN